MPRVDAIVHVTESLGGGVLKVVQALANASASEDIPTTVVHGRRPETPGSPRVGFDERVRLVEVPRWGTRSALGVFANARAGATIFRELGRHERGVLHLHSTFAGIVGRVIPTRGWSVLYTPHAYAFLNPSIPAGLRRGIRALERVLAGRAHTVACSQTEGHIAEEIARRGRVSVVQNGIDVAHLADPIPEPSGDFVVASVGRAAYQRRPDLVAGLAASLQDELGLRVIWFGDGPFRDELAEAGVEVTGWLTEQEAERAFGQANVVLHLSAFEGLPLALLEAMAAARAVVATDLPSIREAVGDTAMLVTGAADAAAAIRTLRSDEDLRAQLGARARERVERQFTQSGMVERMLATYRRDHA